MEREMKKQCEEYELLIVSYLDGESEETDKREVFLHIAECASCRGFWETMTEMKLQAAQEIRRVAPATLDRRILVGTIRRTSSTKVARLWNGLVRGRVFMPAPVALLLALFLLSGGAGLAFLLSSTPPPAKEVIEPVVFVKFPAVEIKGNADQREIRVQ
jgi:predicted anti-sigma-YlaC factor YlaD